ncbi:UDP-glucose 6-dehydrogenase, UdgL domain protein [Mycobacterium ulcerans str. Harvey]|uniref:UDP-glucose 6-dehydrogenase, UdgL domain protein n=1 Tax=Mycobacterium ulcerans str. Harvey TaxID=1299332 RepID=A0ABP3AIN0_MYCUL|nr:UDP-glucose 6-dehydrogenase, UdgL domain protein [Mycobacterium ulcerans str. Harvey]
MLADEGYNVDILDTNAEALETIMAGRMPFIETGAEISSSRCCQPGESAVAPIRRWSATPTS